MSSSCDDKKMFFIYFFFSMNEQVPHTWSKIRKIILFFFLLSKRSIFWHTFQHQLFPSNFQYLSHLYTGTEKKQDFFFWFINFFYRFSMSVYEHIKIKLALMTLTHLKYFQIALEGKNFLKWKDSFEHLPDAGSLNTENLNNFSQLISFFLSHTFLSLLFSIKHLWIFN